MSKRQKFIFTSILLSVGMFFIADVDFAYRYWIIFGLAILSLIFSIWSLKEALSGIGWIMSAILPMIFTGGVGFFYFLLPQNFTLRLLMTILYAIGIYALLLTENIFLVASIRTIQLFRAAQAVGYLLTLFTLFLVFDTIFSFRFPYYLNFFLIFVTTFPLFLQGIWSIKLEEQLSRELFFYALIMSLMIAEIGLILSFWPLTIAIRSIVLTTLSYVILGLIQASIQERLFKQTIIEYTSVGGIIFIILILTTRWG